MVAVPLCSVGDVHSKRGYVREYVARFERFNFDVNLTLPENDAPRERLNENANDAE